MEVVIVALVAMVVLDVAAVLWGCDSTDGFLSREWERRSMWHTREGR